MSRRRRSAPVRARPAPPAKAPAASGVRSLDAARPPRPNKWFLAIAVALLLAWTALLAVMAAAC